MKHFSEHLQGDDLKRLKDLFFQANDEGETPVALILKKTSKCFLKEFLYSVGVIFNP
ncbi:MAG: hypothetical protein K2X94_02805 [Amoebophilaceae bacterium]|nr:hypothetical protein [Amoebophilaceae bacterium]